MIMMSIIYTFIGEVMSKGTLETSHRVLGTKHQLFGPISLLRSKCPKFLTGYYFGPVPNSGLHLAVAMNAVALFNQVLQLTPAYSLLILGPFVCHFSQVLMFCLLPGVSCHSLLSVFLCLIPITVHNMNIIIGTVTNGKLSDFLLSFIVFGRQLALTHCK